jgi:hypothetical protein
VRARLIRALGFWLARNYMNGKDSYRIAVLVGIISMYCFSTAAQTHQTRLKLTDKDKEAIVESVLADGFEELDARLEKPNILNNCSTLILGNERVAFISLKNIESRFGPKITGVHFEFMTPEEITKEVQANDRHCYFEFTRFEVVGSKVMVIFGKFLRRPVYIYGESFKYEYSKVSGKWRGKYIGKTVIES